MTTVFEGTTKFGGIGSRYYRVMVIEDRVIIRAINPRVEKAATISMTPKHARELAAGIVAAAEKAQLHQ